MSLAFQDIAFRATPFSVRLTSPAFADGNAVPARHTIDGDGTSPPLAWSGVPSAARQLVLLVEDADALTPMPRVHAIAWDLHAADGTLIEGGLGQVVGGPSLGKASSLVPAYLPLDPPTGHGAHRYAFQLFAIGDPLPFERPPGRRTLLAAMRKRVLAAGVLWGTYERAAYGRHRR